MIQTQSSVEFFQVGGGRMELVFVLEVILLLVLVEVWKSLRIQI